MGAAKPEYEIAPQQEVPVRTILRRKSQLHRGNKQYIMGGTSSLRPGELNEPEAACPKKLGTGQSSCLARTLSLGFPLQGSRPGGALRGFKVRDYFFGCSRIEQQSADAQFDSSPSLTSAPEDGRLACQSRVRRDV
jgi:hypothetical protein